MIVIPQHKSPFFLKCTSNTQIILLLRGEIGGRKCWEPKKKSADFVASEAQKKAKIKPKKKKPARQMKLFS